MSERTFIWCVRRTCYLPPQLSKVLIHQFYLYLVFTCLWVGTHDSNMMNIYLLHYGLAAPGQSRV